MPFIRFLAFVRCILLAASISLNGEIMSPYSYYIKKGLVYITILEPAYRNYKLLVYKQDIYKGYKEDK